MSRKRAGVARVAALLALALPYCFTAANRVLLFWAAFILTPPLVETVVDFLDKPQADGCSHSNRFIASAARAGLHGSPLIAFAQRPAKAVHGA